MALVRVSGDVRPSAHQVRSLPGRRQGGAQSGCPAADGAAKRGGRPELRPTPLSAADRTPKPRRAQSSPRHACGLFPPVFPHPCTTPERPWQRRAADPAWWPRSLRIPARKGCYPRAVWVAEVRSKSGGGSGKGQCLFGFPNCVRNLLIRKRKVRLQRALIESNFHAAVM